MTFEAAVELPCVVEIRVANSSTMLYRKYPGISKTLLSQKKGR